MSKILIVEDNLDLAATIVDWLRAENHTVDHSSCGADALHLISISKFDLFILDWELPDMAGTDICRVIKQKDSSNPVIMLTGRSSSKDVITGLDVGADDYVRKPCSLQELSARIRALVRRAPEDFISRIGFGDIEIDPQSRTAWISGVELKLLRQEFELLSILIGNPNRYYSASQLVGLIWKEPQENAEILFPCVSRLRKKLSANGSKCSVESSPGQGYKLAAGAHEGAAAKD